MNSHVFVVDKDTFKTHLEFLFAGTGAKNHQASFLYEAETTKIHHFTERNLVDMISDISRIRKGDNIIFYLQSHGNNPGRFFGIFEADSRAFFDENDKMNYLMNDLGKGLSFRIKIKPKEVFAQGVTEHEYLDDISDKEHPYQMCWSLIYRKLKARRGCTMITPHEFDDLYNKLEEKNNGERLECKNYTFDKDLQMIACSNNDLEYNGRTDSLDIARRLCVKAKKGNAFESHLQAYILQNYDGTKLKEFFCDSNDKLQWTGNEVSCGVGMQRIDILMIQDIGKTINMKVVELKDEEPYNEILDRQLPWYVDWLIQYIVPNYESKEVTIQPCIVAKKTNNKKIIDRMKNERIESVYSAGYSIKETEYISFEFDKEYSEIIFNKEI